MIEVRLQAFEGPLDLLLHLIEESQVDIYDIPIAEIASQYLAYIREAQSLDLEVAAEFLVMAATLMLIKARTLVPQAPVEYDGDGDEFGEEVIDPREELVQRLLEYRRFKEAAKSLAVLEEEASRLYSREPSIPEVHLRDVPLPKALSLADLFEAFQKVMGAHTEATVPFRRIPRDEINIGHAMRTVFARVLREGQVSFFQLFSADKPRNELMATFLGILELVRLGKVTVQQDGLYQDIHICLRESTASEPADSQSYN